MLDLIILSDKPITHDSCAEEIKKEFKSLVLLNDDNETLYMKKSRRGFELWFSPEDRLDDPESLMGNTVDLCPNKKAYLTNLSYTSKNIAKRLIQTLSDKYGNIWIQSDEEDDWFGTKEEFIEINKNE